jgi:hypothetical protein
VADEREHPKAVEQTIEEEAGLPSNWSAVNSSPVIPGRQRGGPTGGPPQAITGIDNFQSGQLPPFLGLSPDLVGAGTPGPGVPTTRLMPIAPGGLSQIVSATKSVVQPLIDKAIASIPRPPPVKPTIVVMEDNFYPYFATTISPTPVSQIGQLGWALHGTIGTFVGFLGGAYPNVGQFYWSNDAVASDAGWLNIQLGGPSTASYAANGLALFDSPGWTMTFIFKLEASFDSLLNFNMTQKSMYIGLIGVTTTASFENTISRPDTFVGLRFDTSATAPAISDTFYTYEVVANPTGTSQVRQNTQGTTKVTTVTPAVDGWHTLVITCPSAGQVNMTLDGAEQFTASVPAVTVTGTVNALWGNGLARFAWLPAATPPQPVCPWSAGTSLTVLGFGSPNTMYNGTFQLANCISSELWFDLPITASTATGTGVTLSGYPAFVPSFSFGNDDTASPSANDAFFFVDFFGYTV